MNSVQQLTFTIPGRLPGRNEQEEAARIHRQKAGALKKRWTEWVRMYANAKLRRIAAAGDTWDPSARYDIDLYWVEPNRRRDPDNISAAIKFVLDGMQPNMLANDGWKNVRSITHYFGVEHDPCVVVTLRRAVNDGR